MPLLAKVNQGNSCAVQQNLGFLIAEKSHNQELSPGNCQVPFSATFHTHTQNIILVTH
jgi:hypothetical protein